MKKYLFIRLKPRIAKRAFAVIIIFLCGGAIYAFAGPVALTPQQANILYAGRLAFQNATSGTHKRLKSYNNVSGIAVTATSVFSYFTSTTPIVDDAGVASFVPANEYWGTGTYARSPQWTLFHATNGYSDISSIAVNALPKSGGTMTGAIRGDKSAAFGNTTCIPWGDGEHLTGITASQVGLGNVTNNLQHTAAAFSSYSGNQAPIISGLQVDDTNYAKAALPKSGGTMTGPIRGGQPATFGNVSSTGSYYGDGSKLTGITTTPSLNYVSQYLSSDVIMTTAGYLYDGPSVTLSTGTWLITGVVSVKASSPPNTAYVTARLWDGTNIGCITEQIQPYAATGSVPFVTLPVTCIAVVASGTATWKISVVASSASYVISSSCVYGGTGSVSSGLNAIRIGP